MDGRCPRTGSGILTWFPFTRFALAPAEATRRTHPLARRRRYAAWFIFSLRFLQSFRPGLPMCNCCSHRTLLHFGPQTLSFESSLLPPRSALKVDSRRGRPRPSQSPSRLASYLTPSSRGEPPCSRRQGSIGLENALAPSILGADSFGR